MSKRALSIILLTGIVLSACGGQAAQATETPTTAPTNTAPPATTSAPTEVVIPVTGETSTPAPTPTAFVPENAADCVNNAKFVSDVTIPDNSNITAGSAFTKTWRIQNAGTCIWWSGYTLEHYSENALSAPASVPLPVTNPGENADISVDLVAPSVAGTYRGNFVVKNPEGLIMQVDNDSRLWLIIDVGAAPTAAPTVSGGGVATAATGSGSGSANAACALTTDAARTSAMVTALTAYRAQSGLPALPVNVQLSQAAQAHANDLACNNKLQDMHKGTDGSEPKDRVAATGYAASGVTENVQGEYPPLDGQGVVAWWANDLKEPAHNENLLTTKYTEIGIAYAFFNNFGYYVIVFATP